MKAEQIAQMTLDDLAAFPKRTVGTAIAAHFMETDRWNVTLMARQGILPFPKSQYWFSGNRLHIVKDSLLQMFGRNPS